MEKIQGIIAYTYCLAGIGAAILTVTALERHWKLDLGWITVSGRDLTIVGFGVSLAILLQSYYLIGPELKHKTK